MKNIKLNVGASPIWVQEGWHVLDHKPPRDHNQPYIIGDAADIPLPEGSCQTVFSGHMVEHIPHTKLEGILLEFNRVLEEDGIIRILTPDLKRIAKAYVEEDDEFFKELLDEDQNIRTDLGYGGMLMNCVVSPGQDTALFNRDLTEFIAGYAHLYLYDYAMMSTLLERCGFYKITQRTFLDTEFEDYKEPLRVVGLGPEYHNLNSAFFKEHSLVHDYDDQTGSYNINFQLTGFDRDPGSSLIVEARKHRTAETSSTGSGENYNRYGQSLMRAEAFRTKTELLKAISSIIDSSALGRS